MTTKRTTKPKRAKAGTLRGWVELDWQGVPSCWSNQHYPLAYVCKTKPRRPGVSVRATLTWEAP